MNIDNCPKELAIYVHGVWATDEIASKQTEESFYLKKKLVTIFHLLALVGIPTPHFLSMICPYPNMDGIL
ncbi:MAG: hypothetical protein ACPKPY_07940 [Nitrososphaeraceae archaeon]